MNNIKWWNLELQDNASKVLLSAFENKYLSYGPIGAELEKKLCTHLNINHCMLTTSGSTAIVVALKALGIKPEDEVIVPNRTFQATANAVEFLGAKVRLADVDETTGLITASSIKKLLTPKTKAVIVVHLNGRAVDLDPIMKLKESFDFTLIEDTAQAFNCKYKGKFLGTIGDIGCFSLGVTKFITSGQGGFVITNNDKSFAIMRNYLFHGMSGLDDKSFNESGFNFRQSDLLSSLALNQLNNLDEKSTSFLKVYKQYGDSLKDINCVKLISSKITEGEIPIWIEVIAQKRDDLFEYLKNKGIEAVKFYPSLHRSTHLNVPDEEIFPHSSLFEQSGLILPCGPQISTEAIDRVTSALREYDTRS